MLLTPQPSLVEQAYEAMLGEIADGTLAPNTHLVQEDLAARYDVSRHPIQQALLLLKNDGIVRDAGRRGLIVAPLDLRMMRDRYQVRATLDALAARLAAQRCAASTEVAADLRHRGELIVEAGLKAVEDGGIAAMIARDVAFHAFIYAASGNPMIAPTAEIHWRFLRRVMGEVLRRSAPPPTIWQQHREILAAIVAGEAADAETRILGHISDAADRLTDNTDPTSNQEEGGERAQRRRANRMGDNRSE
jgi:DNA-binding GntR family transcriptional regulator